MWRSCLQARRFPSWGIAASSASGLILKLGNFGWFLALFFGFWVMYSTAISNVDLVVRQSTNMLWFAQPGIRKWAKEDIRKIYYTLLVAFVIWGLMYVNITLPLIIFAISANIANFTMALSAAATIRLNRKVLPPELRPAVWCEFVLILNVLFFGFFFTMFFTLKVLGIKF